VQFVLNGSNVTVLKVEKLFVIIFLLGAIFSETMSPPIDEQICLIELGYSSGMIDL
jgi:hypothetical protein